MPALVPMQTRVLLVRPDEPELDAVAEAAAVLRAGGLVAFPTETVYGLGANALEAVAVGRIFAAKGRPASNPVIVHVARAEDARPLVAGWPETATALAEKFWPGPLTFVLPRSNRVPLAVTAGGPTVAVRAPRHPVARALIEAAGLPVAAPSANRSTRLSPTRAAHVLRDLAGRIDLVLDGGPTPGGLESTVLDLTATPPRLLRPGLVTVEEIEAVVGPVTRTAPPAAAPGRPARSPGLQARHYAPRARLECGDSNARFRVASLAQANLRVGWLLRPGEQVPPDLEESPSGVHPVVMPADPDAYAAQLYSVLHALDDEGVDRIVVELPPDTDRWLAVRDRLRRASTPPDEVNPPGPNR